MWAEQPVQIPYRALNGAQVAQDRRDGAAQLVGKQPQLFQIAQIHQFSWDGTAELVFIQREAHQVGQVAQLGRDGDAVFSPLYSSKSG